MEYKVAGFTVYNGHYSEMEKWINEMAKEGFEVDSWESKLIGSGQLAERIVVMMKKRQKVNDISSEIRASDAKGLLEALEVKEKQKAKSKSENKQ